MRLVLVIALAAVSGCLRAAWAAAGTTPATMAQPVLTLRTEASVDGRGVFLGQVADTGASLPALRIGDAPVVGQPLQWSRAQITERLRQLAPDLASTSWVGAEQVRIVRRSRSLDEAGLVHLLTRTLQDQVVRDKGELELRLTRAWTPLTVPDEPLQLKVLELPAGGLGSYSSLRVELIASNQPLGNWCLSVKVRLLREIPVAATALQRRQAVRATDFLLDRRDVLQYRDVLTELPVNLEQYEAGESLAAGAPVTRRSLLPKPVIHRGEVVEALWSDGALAISLKVEALDNGAPGQTVRVRNLTTRKEFRGKVRDEQTVLVSL